ncbi:MAG TPA: AAA family ATPase [Smithella sp.]|nr:AAA family ATPase [Smithella sp.]MDM7986304.1 AAA family ATPase [Smithella sp.]HOG89328.1 AAA family ATPase [Smithella sp.]HOU50138.1 AAA family ATPase [Smithella sp.]HQG64721.1 AAA family ATPase [Smithella sp.]
MYKILNYVYPESTMHLKDVTFYPKKYPVTDCYPFNLTLFHETKRLTFDVPVTLFVGENGTGKSTLLEALAAACDIHIWRDTQRSRPDCNPYEDKFFRYLSIRWSDGAVPGSFFGSKVFQYFAELLDAWAVADRGQLNYFGGQSLTTQSHGQSLMSFFRSRYRVKGLYLLDEPETALSPRSQIELLQILEEMTADDHAQFIIATHSPLLLACPRAVIYTFDKSPIQRIRYEETDHFVVYKDFMNNRSKYLQHNKK